MDKIKISIIEDNEALQLMYKYKLELEGFEVSQALNGKDGLELIKEIRPELILLDLKMPVMSGDEMLKELRTEEWGSKIKVIVLTNVSKDEAPSILRILNVDRYIVKAQHTPDQIIEDIKNILNIQSIEKV